MLFGLGSFIFIFQPWEILTNRVHSLKMKYWKKCKLAISQGIILYPHVRLEGLHLTSFPKRESKSSSLVHIQDLRFFEIVIHVDEVTSSNCISLQAPRTLRICNRGLQCFLSSFCIYVCYALHLRNQNHCMSFNCIFYDYYLYMTWFFRQL